jgi:predicted GTPase
VRRRIREGTGVDVEPIYYSAGYKESEYDKQNPYNLSKLLYYIIQHVPAEKRFTVLNNTSRDKNNWKDNEPDILDKLKDKVVETAVTWIGEKIIEHFVPPVGVVNTAKKVFKVAKKILDWLF